jgi:hypothetical protein
VAKAVAAKTIVFFDLNGHDKPSPPGSTKKSDVNREGQ